MSFNIRDDKFRIDIQNKTKLYENMNNQRLYNTNNRFDPLIEKYSHLNIYKNDQNKIYLLQVIHDSYDLNLDNISINQEVCNLGKDEIETKLKSIIILKRFLLKDNDNNSLIEYLNNNNYIHIIFENITEYQEIHLKYESLDILNIILQSNNKNIIKKIIEKKIFYIIIINYISFETNIKIICLSIIISIFNDKEYINKFINKELLEILYTNLTIQGDNNIIINTILILNKISKLNTQVLKIHNFNTFINPLINIFTNNSNNKIDFEILQIISLLERNEDMNKSLQNRDFLVKFFDILSNNYQFEQYLYLLLHIITNFTHLEEEYIDFCLENNLINYLINIINYFNSVPVKAKCFLILSNITACCDTHAYYIINNNFDLFELLEKIIIESKDDVDSESLLIDITYTFANFSKFFNENHIDFLQRGNYFKLIVLVYNINLETKSKYIFKLLIINIFKYLFKYYLSNISTKEIFFKIISEKGILIMLEELLLNENENIYYSTLELVETYLNYKPINN